MAYMHSTVLHFISTTSLKSIILWSLSSTPPPLSLSASPLPINFSQSSSLTSGKWTSTTWDALSRRKRRSILCFKQNSQCVAEKVYAVTTDMQEVIKSQDIVIEQRFRNKNLVQRAKFRMYFGKALTEFSNGYKIEGNSCDFKGYSPSNRPSDPTVGKTEHTYERGKQ